jgi:hypothetical protein
MRVPSGDIAFTEPDATNPLDNEHPDVNRHAVYVYLRTKHGSAAWSITPVRGSSAPGVRQISGWGSLRLESAEWSPTSEGFEVGITLPAYDEAAIDVIINDVGTGRSRRRGQLVMSGGRGEFVYLRGDRHDSARLVPLRVN